MNDDIVYVNTYYTIKKYASNVVCLYAQGGGLNTLSVYFLFVGNSTYARIDTPYNILQTKEFGQHNEAFVVGGSNFRVYEGYPQQ